MQADSFVRGFRLVHRSMQSERLSSNRVRDGARFVATELIREPVRTAVRDALREEAETAARTEEGSSTATVEYDVEEPDESSGRSRRFWAGLLVSMVGVAFLARRRMSNSSSWSEGQADTGYSTEGEIQTGETAGEDVTPDDPDHSPKTEQ